VTARILTHAEVSALYDAGVSWRTVGDLAAIARDPECAGALALAAPSLRATALDALDRLSAAHARIAELESLAAGPRTTVDDTGLARPFAAETLAHGWDADGREVR